MSIHETAIHETAQHSDYFGNEFRKSTFALNLRDQKLFHRCIHGWWPRTSTKGLTLKQPARQTSPRWSGRWG
jgi:hypothetical protein